MDYQEAIKKLIKQASRCPHLNLIERHETLVQRNTPLDKIYESLKAQSEIYIRLHPDRGRL